MSKDLEVRNMETTKLEQIFLRDITVHQGKLYMILQNWVQPFLQEISALMTQLDRPNNIQSEIRTENLRKNHKIYKNAQHDLLCGDPMSPTSPEIREIVKTRGVEFERSQSPYSIALVPQINSKITQRPPHQGWMVGWVLNWSNQNSLLLFLIFLFGLDSSFGLRAPIPALGRANFYLERRNYPTACHCIVQ